MKHFNLIFTGVSSLIISSTCFADITPSHYNWSGFYAGLNAGLVNHTLNMTDTQAVTFNSTIQQTSNPSPIGGFQLGYRRQLDLTNTTGVFGAEISADFANARFKKQYGSPFALYNLNSSNELNNVYLLELIGGIAAERTLLFIAAGFSYTHITGNTTNVAGTPFFNSFNVNQSSFGSALGAGIEYAINDSISARLKVDVITPNSYSTSDNTGNSYQITNSIVQGVFGVNVNLEKVGWIKA